MMDKRWLPFLFLPLASVMAGSVAAEQFVVRMGTAADPFRFAPEITYIQPHDTVEFVATDHLHASRSIASMCSGETAWRGQMGKSVTVTFDQPGIYGFRCDAHYNMGMVGLIVVGDNPPVSNGMMTMHHTPRAEAEFRRLFDQLAEHEAGNR